jgi:hypothetical protein
VNTREAISVIVAGLVEQLEVDVMERTTKDPKGDFLRRLDALAFLISPTRSIELTVGSNQEATMDKKQQRDLLIACGAARSELQRAVSNPTNQDLAETVGSLAAVLENVLAVLVHVIDAAGPSEHAQAVDGLMHRGTGSVSGKLREELETSQVGDAPRMALDGPGRPAGDAPKAGQEGTAGAKQGGPGWPEVERQGKIGDRFYTVEPDPRD